MHEWTNDQRDSTKDDYMNRNENDKMKIYVIKHEKFRGMFWHSRTFTHRSLSNSQNLCMHLCLLIKERPIDSKLSSTYILPIV